MVYRNRSQGKWFQAKFLILFMVQLVYFLMSNLTIGFFYGMFSIVTRSNLSSSSNSTFHPANVLENLLIFLLVLIMLGSKYRSASEGYFYTVVAGLLGIANIWAIIAAVSFVSSELD